VKFFQLPNLYCVTTLPSKTNTTANIIANSWTGTHQSQRYGVGRSNSYGEDKGGLHRFWSESYQLILLQYRPREGSAAWHQSNMSSLQVDTAARLSASAHRPDNDGLFEKKSTSTPLNLTRCLQIALILIPWITLFGYFSATSLPPTTIRDGGKTAASDSHRVAKTLTAFHW